MIDFSYKNETSRMIIVRCVGEKSVFIEKVIFPSEIIAFNARKGARVEIRGNQIIMRVESKTSGSQHLTT